MKKLLRINTGFVICFFAFSLKLFGQDDKPEVMLNVNHYTENNAVQYVGVRAQLKADNKLQPMKDVDVQLYLDSVSGSNLIARLKTDERGSAQTIIPAGLKNSWDAQPAHKFIAIAKSGAKEPATTAELEITKAKIEIDTLNADGVRSVTAKVVWLNNGEWIPAKGVEVKIGAERLGGSLKIGDDESYTTDSSGQVSAEFKLDSLPSYDTKGDIVLLAKVEDNDQFGNLMVEKTVPWGKYYKHSSTFGQRSLSAARFRSPLWLSFMAYSIVGAVWGVILYLIVQIIRIKRLGNVEIPEKEKFPAEELMV